MHNDVEMQKRRYFSAHHTMLRIARHKAAEAKGKGNGYSDAAFISITMSCLAFEAVCNAIGDKMIKDWQDLQQVSSPSVKARIICMTLGIEYDKNTQPWKTLSEMQSIRNKIAHPKPDLINVRNRIRKADWLSSKKDRPYSKLELRMTPKMADDAMTAVEAALCVWGQRLNEDDQFDILHEGWTASAWTQPTS